ncbi:Vomeronasal type-2 receptor 26, partial [Tupaia chinensis]
FLKKIEFTNSAGDHVSLNKKRKQIACYDIRNIVETPDFTRTMVKVGEFSYSPHAQNLIINKMMIKWPASFKEVTYGPFDPILSDKDQFTSLYQMATKDSSLVYGIITLLLHFGWTWVALFVSDDMKGEQFLQELKAKMVKKDICVAFTEKVLSIINLYGWTSFTFVNQIRDSSVSVHILYVDVGSFFTLGEFFLTSGKVWIIGNPPLAELEFAMDEFILLYAFQGGFSFLHQKRIIPGFEQFVNSLNPYQYTVDFYFSQFWIALHHCLVEGKQCIKSIDCPPNSSLKFTETYFSIKFTSESSYFIYNAVYAVAQVLHKMLVEKIEMGFPGDSDQPVLLPWQVNLHKKQDMH